ncbi:unnamed protein product, partial [Ascophyllum nodosum]
VESDRADAGQDGRTCLARPNFQAQTGDREKLVLIYPIRLTTSRVSNHIRLIPSVLQVMFMHTKWFYARDQRHLPMTRAISQGLRETSNESTVECAACWCSSFSEGDGSKAGRVRRGRSVTGRWCSFRMTGKPPRERHRSKGDVLEHGSGSCRAACSSKGLEDAGPSSPTRGGVE